MLEGEERTDSSLWAGVTWGRWKLFASTEALLTGASHPGPGLLLSLSGSDFFVLVLAVFCLARASA